MIVVNINCLNFIIKRYRLKDYIRKLDTFFQAKRTKKQGDSVLVRVSVVVERYYVLSNSYKGRHFTWYDGLQFQMFSWLSSW